MLFVDDDRMREVMWLPFVDGQAGTPRAGRMPTDVVVSEGMTFDGRSPTLERTFPRGTKPEGITRMWLDGTTRAIVVYDGSGYLVFD